MASNWAKKFLQQRCDPVTDTKDRGFYEIDASTIDAAAEEAILAAKEEAMPFSDTLAFVSNKDFVRSVLDKLGRWA